VWDGFVDVFEAQAEGFGSEADGDGHDGVHGSDEDEHADSPSGVEDYAGDQWDQ